MPIIFNEIRKKTFCFGSKDFDKYKENKCSRVVENLKQVLRNKNESG